jgi:hypothetical protein
MRVGLLSKLTDGRSYTGTPNSIVFVSLADCLAAICHHLFVQMLYNPPSESHEASFLYISYVLMFAATTNSVT